MPSTVSVTILIPQAVLKIWPIKILWFCASQNMHIGHCDPISYPTYFQGQGQKRGHFVIEEWPRVGKGNLKFDLTDPVTLIFDLWAPK